jgi:ribonuclease Z
MFKFCHPISWLCGRFMVWVRDGIVPDFPSMAPPKFDIAAMGGLVIPAPRVKRQDVQEQSIRDAEISPDEYYPKGYKPDLISFWPTTKPIFIPADQVPPGLWLKGKHAGAAQPAPVSEASKSPVKK